MAQVRNLVTILLCFLSLSAVANPLERIEIKPGIFALIGPMEQRSPDNLANNANFGFVVYEEGVVLIDSGGTLAGAKAIEAEIRSITDKPVTYVINTGGQDHRWFGNHYFAQQGAKTLTSLQTREDQQARGANEAEKTANYTAQSWFGTQPQIASRTIGTSETLLLNSPFQMEIIPVGPAHTGGETLVWLPKQKVLFSGDVVYVDRMLGVGPQSHHLAWLGAFETIQGLSPDVIVPGHGSPTDLPGAEKDTYTYLKFLRKTVGRLLEEGQDMSAASQIDQRQFSYLKVYDEIHARNALRVFEEMEWE
jgi:glyoxylase-like metal-dependent hydrolase (beta-lactamase superfamily II)